MRCAKISTTQSAVVLQDGQEEPAETTKASPESEAAPTPAPAAAAVAETSLEDDFDDMLDMMDDELSYEDYKRLQKALQIFGMVEATLKKAVQELNRIKDAGDATIFTSVAKKGADADAFIATQYAEQAVAFCKKIEEVRTYHQCDFPTKRC